MTAGISPAERLFSPHTFQAGGDGPLYVRLKAAIQDAVASGRLRADDALPPQREIATALGISRVTVRKAIESLASEGVVHRRRGSGTFVAARIERVQQPLSRLTSFTEDMESRGLAPDSRWLARSLSLPSPEEAMVLGLSPGEQVCRIDRLRLANDVPMAIERAIVPTRFLSDPKSVTTSLYTALVAADWKPVRALQRLRAEVVSAEDAELLDIAAKSAVLRIERVSYVADGRVVEFTRSHYRGDAYDFVAELNLADGAAG